LDDQSDSDVRRALAAVGATMTGYRSFVPSGPAGGQWAGGEWTGGPEGPPSPFPLLTASLPGTEWTASCQAVPEPSAGPAPVADVKRPAAARVAAGGNGPDRSGPDRNDTGHDGLAAMFRVLHGTRAQAAAGQSSAAGLGDLFRRL
jgi:hypothetical protein